MAPKIVNCCINVVRWTPVVFITAVIVWSYYAYVIQMCIFTIFNDSKVQAVIYLLAYHPVIIIFLWAYWKTIFSEPGGVPKEFFLSSQDIQRFNTTEDEDTQREILARHGRSLPVQCRTNSGAFRFCEKCYCIKPDRAHHCSVCGQCILKMDHHCPWVNNCVNYTNYKFFVLFLGYGLIYCIYVAATSAQYFVKFWTQSTDKNMNNLHIVFLFFAGVMFAISLVSLFGYHCYLTAVNRSTLESFRAPIFQSGPDKDGFSLGKQGNFQEVFGDIKFKWFLPIFSSMGDGVSYPTRIAISEVNNYHSTEESVRPSTISNTVDQVTITDQPIDLNQTDPKQSFGDGVNFPVRTVDEDYDRLLGDRQRWMEEGEGESHELDFHYGSTNGQQSSIFMQSGETTMSSQTEVKNKGISKWGSDNSDVT